MRGAGTRGAARGQACAADPGPAWTRRSAPRLPGARASRPAGAGRGPRVEEAPRRRPHRERALPSAHFILNNPEAWRCFPILPMRKVRLRELGSCPRGHRSRGIWGKTQVSRLQGRSQPFPARACAGRFRPAWGPRGAKVGAPVPAQPLGISSWGPKEGPAGARRHVDHASPLPRPPGHTARGPVSVGASERGQPSALCGRAWLEAAGRGESG